MQINYENTLDQLVDLYRYQLKNYPPLKKERSGAIFASPLIIVGAFMLIAYTSREPGLVVAGIVGGTVMMVWAILRYRRWPERTVENQAKSLALDDFLCVHTVTITEDRFEEKTSNTLNASSWSSLHEVVFTDDYVFVFPNFATAHTIPRIGVGDEQFEAFSRLVKQYYEAR